MTAILKKLIVAGAALLAAGFAAQAQQREVWALKTNLLRDATLTINAGVEHQIAPHWSIDLSGDFNAWTIDDRRWKRWNVQPEVRYWLCEAIGGHFFALHALGGQYNFGNLDLDFDLFGTDYRKLKDNRYQGWYVGGGIGYGYSWMLSRHLNIEAELGIGYAYTRFSSYPCAECGTKIDDNKPHHYFGPTKVALNLVYVF